MNAEVYKDIINSAMFPFVASTYKNNNINLHQDNDPKHKSNLCLTALEELHIDWVTLSDINFYYFNYGKFF